MSHRDQTDMGGSREAFLTTQWSLIEDVKAGEDPDRMLIGFLLEQYWKPVYCYLRRRGYDNEQAKDLTQAFFHEIVLNTNLVERADQTKGRFRSFLLCALGRYAAKQTIKEKAQKRIPPEKLVSLDVVKPLPSPPSLVQTSPEAAYHHAWLSVLLARVLTEVEVECERQGLTTHWALFQERIVRPILDAQPTPSLSDLCQAHGLEDPKTASNMIITVKRRFRAALLQHVRQTVLSSDQAADELEELLQFLPEGAQHLQQNGN